MVRETADGGDVPYSKLRMNSNSGFSCRGCSKPSRTTCSVVTASSCVIITGMVATFWLWHQGTQTTGERSDGGTQATNTSYIKPTNNPAFPVLPSHPHDNLIIVGPLIIVFGLFCLLIFCFALGIRRLVHHPNKMKGSKGKDELHTYEEHPGENITLQEMDSLIISTQDTQEDPEEDPKSDSLAADSNRS